MPKKRFLLGFIVFMVLLLLAAAGLALLFIPKKVAPFPDFSSMPTDTAGNNMIGNLPENLEAGGFMAGQNGWIYFASFSDNGKLYMCRENGADMTKLTDFPVCNINVMGSSVVFTGFDSYAEYESKGTGTTSGKLYAIYGLHSATKPRLCAIDPDTAYYAPSLDRDGLYATFSDGAHGLLANKSNGMKMVVTREGEDIVKKFSYGNTIYAELYSEMDKTSRILRVDAKTLFPLDSINGGRLYRVGGGFVFHGEDGFVYELAPATNEIKPISGVPVKSLRINAFCEILADTDSGKLVLSKEQWYSGIAETLLSRREQKPITMQNGWYSYYNVGSRHGGDMIYFNANGKYYHYSLGVSRWSADWLKAKLDSNPLVDLADVIVEDLFTPPWLDFSEDAEPIDPADAGDFGSERPVRPSADSRLDAASDAQNALDAAILLLLDDHSIADKYTGESVEMLRAGYGDAFDTALTEAADKLSGDLKSRAGIELSPQEAHESIMSWLKSTTYETGSVRVASNGTEAVVSLTAANAVDLDLLYSALEAVSDDIPAYMEILREPVRRSIMSSVPESTQIYMRMTSDGCWIAESPDKLINVFILGLEERRS